jgi:hypothetical protein
VSARVSRVWLEVNALNVHSVCDELLIHPHYIDQCEEMLGLVFSTNQLLGTIPQLNQVCQVGLQLFKKETKLCEKYGSTNACYNLFHLVFLSFTFCPAQRIPTKRFLSPIQVYELPTGFPSKVSTKPLDMHFFNAYNSRA